MVCCGGTVAAVQAEIVGDCVIVIVEPEAQTDLCQAAAGIGLVDVEFTSRQIDTVDIADQCSAERPVGGCAKSLEVCGLQGGCAKGAVLDVSHETLEDADGVAAANDAKLFDFEYDAGDSRVIGDATGHKR